jgi:RND superfamily putative drug exporter
MPTPPHRGPLVRVARWSITHRRTALLTWLVLVVAALGLSGAAGTHWSNNSSLPGTDAQRATDLLKRDFTTQAGDIDQIVIHTRTGRVTDAAVKARITPMLAQVAKVSHVTGVSSPYAAGGADQISRDGRTAFATVHFDKRGFDVSKSSAKKVISVAEGARSPGLQVELGGQAIEQAQQVSLGAVTVVGIVAAILILLLTFGSFVAMGLPIITALLGLGTGIGLIGLGSHVLAMPNFSTELAVMIGLGVGIDYALFIVTRFRENFRNGDDVETATLAAMDTAGRAVVFAGCTVIIALLGMFVLGIAFLRGLAVAASLGVLMTMLASVTALPVLLSKYGERIGRGGRMARRRPAKPADQLFWARWARVVQRRPWPAAVAGVLIMLVLAVPALSLRLGSSDAGNDSTSRTTRKAYDAIATGFGKGANGPLQIVAELPRGGDRTPLKTVSATLRSTPDVAAVSPARVAPNGRTAVIEVYPKTAPQDQATTHLVNTLRNQTLPPVASHTNTTLLVGGPTASQVDFSHVLGQKLPLFIAIVVALAALLLLVVFRSVVIPIQAAVMNLLSIGASLGVIVAIFQKGWLGGLFGVTAGPIEAFIPVMLFAIVFGLSMDYEVFLVSRIHEEWTRKRDASGAVVSGLATTGRVITAAATIMICVFLSFVLGDDRVLKLFGLSLASAVFLDAFVVRSILLPAVLELLGRRTWALPDWLERRLPHVAIDSEVARQAPPVAPPRPAFEES